MSVARAMQVPIAIENISTFPNLRWMIEAVAGCLYDTAASGVSLLADAEV